ncbi:hypothetical protein Pelo_14770 [Pelomyxa schiedti]|nr:hypothetical protein Pelo_14770 [Pelomyxa schiedti]
MPLQTSSVTTASASTYLQHLKLIEETSLALHSWSIKAQQSGDMPEYVGRRFLAKASDAVHLLNAMTALVPPPLRQSLGDMFLNNVKLPPSYLPPSHHHHSTESHTNRPVVTPCQPQLPLCETSKPLAQASSSEKNRPLSPERADKLLEMLKERRPHPPPPAVPASPQPVTQGRPPASNPPKRRRASNAGQKTPRNTVNTLSPTQNMNSPQTPNTQGRAESTSPCKKKSPKGIADPNSGLMENSTGEPLYRTGSYPSECAPLSEKGSFCRDTPATEMSRNGSFDSVDSVGRCPSFPTMDGSNPLAKSASFSVADSGRNLEAKRVMSCDSIKVPIPSRSTETRSYVTALGYASSVPPPNPPCNFRGSGNILPAIVTSPSCNQPPQQNDDCEEGSGSCGNSEDEQPQPSGSLSSKMKIKRHRRESGPYKRPSQFPAHEVPNHLHELVDISELESTQKIESFSTTTSSTINNSATPPPTNQLPPIIQLPSSPPSLPPASRQDQLKPHRQLVSATESEWQGLAADMNSGFIV